MHVIPPMDDEPPPDFVAFVGMHAHALRAETARLVGGDLVADGIYLDVLTDLAGHWRRLAWWGRVSGTDAAGIYLRRRLTARTAQWREDQVYEVEVRVLPPIDHPVVQPVAAGVSLALRKAAILPGTARAALDALADAEIAWVHAWRRSQWRGVARVVGGSVLLVGGMIQYFSWLGAAGV